LPVEGGGNSCGLGLEHVQTAGIFSSPHQTEYWSSHGHCLVPLVGECVCVRI